MSKKQNAEYTRTSCRISLKNNPLQIKYKFIFADPGINEDTIFTGSVQDISSTGAKIIGCIKDPKWVPSLIDDAALLGCNIVLSKESFVKTLARVRWFNTSDCATKCIMGIEFTQMEEDHLALLKKFMIRRQIETSRTDRTQELRNSEYRSL